VSATVHSTALVRDDEIRANHVWTDAQGVTHGALSLGFSSVVFEDPAIVRRVAAELSAMAGVMDAKIAQAKAGGAL
jgi:hypothetical protein